jgi:hypothetical protein
MQLARGYLVKDTTEQRHGGFTRFLAEERDSVVEHDATNRLAFVHQVECVVDFV